jgi:hypothetical protein
MPSSSGIEVLNPSVSFLSVMFSTDSSFTLGLFTTTLPKTTHPHLNHHDNKKVMLDPQEQTTEVMSICHKSLAPTQTIKDIKCTDRASHYSTQTSAKKNITEAQKVTHQNQGSYLRMVSSACKTKNGREHDDGP